MTVPLSAESPRREAARKFSVELRKAMAARGVGRRRLAEQSQLSQSLIAQWRSGNTLPRLDSALRLAECLSWPCLEAIVREKRADQCATCRKPFVNEGGGPKRYCSERCRRLKTKIRGLTPTRVRADVAERGLQLHSSSVMSFCRGCEPDGYCQQPECVLRAVSPLPLRIDVRPAVDLASPAPGPGGEENRGKTLEAIQEANAKRWSRPGERERQSERTRQMHEQGVIPTNTRAKICPTCRQSLPPGGTSTKSGD